MPNYLFDHQGHIGDLYRCERDEAFFPNGKFDRNAFRTHHENNLFL